MEIRLGAAAPTTVLRIQQHLREGTWKGVGKKRDENFCFKSLLPKVNQVNLETLPQGQIVAGACKKHSGVSIVPF